MDVANEKVEAGGLGTIAEQAASSMGLLEPVHGSRRADNRPRRLAAVVRLEDGGT